MLIFGIDPGKAGAIAAIDDGEVYKTTIMPIVGKELDLDAISTWIYDIATDRDCIAYIEKVHSMPSQGVASMFSFGYSVGVMHGILAALSIPRYLVAPQTWKGFLLKDTKKDKDAAVAYCRRTFPRTSLLATERCHKPHDGIADAICIAQYGYIKHRR
jgi:hypothetical protein